MSSIDCSKSSYVRLLERCSVSVARARNIVQLLVVVLGAASLAACAESTVVQNSRFVSPSRQASLPHDPNGIIRRQQACRIREKAYAVRAAPPCDPDTGRLAGNCQLLHRGPTDRERRKVRYTRFDRSPPYVAVWHPFAADKRQDRAIRDSAGQRPRSVHSRRSGRCLRYCSQ